MKKKYETEWSFSFGDLGESIRSSLGSLGIGEDTEVKTASYVEPLDGASEARVQLDPTVGAVSLTALSNSDRLFEADVTYVGTLKFEAEREASKASLRLWQPRNDDVLRPVKDVLGSFGQRQNLRWDMRLSPDIPLDLNINSGLTDSNLDLHMLQLVALHINNGTGDTAIQLPTMGARYPVQVNNGAGSLTVDVPDGAAVDVNINNGAGSTEIHSGDHVNLVLRIKGGVGKCTLHIPAEAPVRLVARTGLGDVRVPEHIAPVKVDQFIATSGTWETADYVDGEAGIDILFEGGVGGFSIETL
jgi:hypothetical protein